MSKRTYALSAKEKKLAAKWYKKGYTTHSKLSRKLGVSRQKVSNWLKSTGRGKRVVSPFWSDVKTIREMKGVSHAEAIKEVKFSKKWFTKRQARLTGVEKARDAMREKWKRIKMGEMERDWWDTEEGEDLLEAAEYD